jgi:anaerobic selenocysteine-containing dehydrogenase
MYFAHPSGLPQLSNFEPELRVVEYVATRKGERERGPQIRLHPADAKLRLLLDGELVWVRGPRGAQVAPLVIDASIAEHSCALRDIAGVDLAEAVRVSKPDLDTPKRTVA